MGLDTIELVMKIEDEFAISIPDEAAEKLVTVGGIYDYLLQRLSMVAAVSCVSQQTFYLLRKTLVERLRVDTSLDRLASPDAWPQFRTQLQDTLGLMTPALPLTLPYVEKVTPPLRNWATWVRCVIVVGCTLLAWSWFRSLEAGLLIAFLTALLVNVGSTKQPETYIASAATIRELVEAILLINQLPATRPKWTPESVWLTLKRIVVEQFGVRPDEVTKEAHIINDLRAD